MRAKWRSSLSAYRSVLENVLDTADIVRDGIFHQLSDKIAEVKEGLEADVR